MTDDETAAAPKARRVRSAPPVLDLSADEVKPENRPVEESHAAPTNPVMEDQAAPQTKWLDLRVFVPSLIGGFVGAAIFAGLMQVWSPSDAISGRMTALETALETTVTKPALTALEQRLAKAEASNSETRRMLSQNPKDPVNVSAIEARIGALETAAAALTNMVPAAPILSDRLATRLTLSALIRARIEAGSPFLSEFEALQSGVEPSQQTALLKPYADTGIPTYDALRSELAGASSLIKSVELPPEATPMGIGERMLQGLSRLVTITPVGKPNSNASNGLKEIDAALVSRNGTKVLELWQSLPSQSQDALAGWAKRVQARRNAEQAADALLLEALAAIKAKGAGQ